MNEVGIAIVGAGSISANHAAAVQKAPNARLVGICDPDASRAGKLAAAHGSPPIYSSLADMLRGVPMSRVWFSPRPIICTRHRRWPVRPAAGTCLSEKPIANTLADALAVQEACDAAKVILRAGFNQRFLNHIRLAKLALERGVVGRGARLQERVFGKVGQLLRCDEFSVSTLSSRAERP